MCDGGDRVEAKTTGDLTERLSAGRRTSVLANKVVLACGVAWLVPIVVAVVRAVRTGWYPIADEALIAIGGRDVLTGHHRLLGTAASVSFEGVLANHPGPLIFDAVALPVRLFGSGPGLAVGIAALNLGAGSVAIVAAARQAGRAAAVATTVGLCLLVWSAGNGVLVDPYNPTASMLPFFAVLVLAWATVNGDRWALAWLVGFGTFCVQANLAYVVTTVPIVVGALGVFLWRRRAQGAVRDVLVRCLPVGALLWAQPILEQVTNGRDGNLARLARNANNLVEPLGLDDGTRRAAVVLSMWPGWSRGNFDGGYTGQFERLPSLWLTTFTLIVLVTVLVALSCASARWLHDSALAALLAATSAFVAIGWVGTVRVPLSPFYGFLAHFVRWLWPIGALTAVAIVLFTIRAVQRWISPAAVPVVAAVTLAGAAAIAVPDGPPALGSDVADKARPAAAELNDLAAERLPASGVVVDFRPPDYSMFTFSLVAALQERGTPFSVTDEISVRQFGDDRRAPIEPLSPVVYVAVGFEALDLWDTAVACVSDLGASNKERLGDARSQLTAALSEPGFTLSDVGARFAASVFAPDWMASVVQGVGDEAAEIVKTPDFAVLLGDGLIVPPMPLDAIARDFVMLRRGLEETTACVVERIG
jgi:hypothetical protein